VELPRNPGKGTVGIFAHDKLARLVEAAKRHPIRALGSERVTLPDLHKERQGEGQRDEEVLRGDVARLEDVMAKTQ